ELSHSAHRNNVIIPHLISVACDEPAVHIDLTTFDQPRKAAAGGGKGEREQAVKPDRCHSSLDFLERGRIADLPQRNFRDSHTCMAHTYKLFLDKAGHIVVYEHERISVHGKDIADLCTFYPKIQDCSQIVPVCEFL